MTQTRREASARTSRAGTKATAGARRRGNVFARVALFIREVVAELGKVIWPSRRELVTYTTVVIIFVTIMVAIVSLMDFAFGEAVLAVFD